MRPVFSSFALPIVTTVVALYFIFAPRVTTETVVTVAKGDTVSAVAQRLENQNVLPSAFLFRIISRAFFADGFVAGAYTISLRDSLFSIAHNMANGITKTKPLVLTIPEGATVEEIGKRVSMVLPLIKADIFVHDAEKYEGYLFPETYYVTQQTTEAEVVEKMQTEFASRTKKYQETAEQQKKKWSDVIILASIIEKEGKSETDRRMIATILERRLAIGMALQVDATFLYTHNKGSAELTLDEMRDDSPYNTYTRPGLPVGPICNPGIESIDAVLNPTPNQYLYYLTGSDGKMHYAKTFAEHVENKKLYLH